MPNKIELPVDDKMKTARCFEVSCDVKERLMEDNPRRHFIEKENELKAKLLDQLVDAMAIRQTLKPTEKAGQFTMYLKLWALTEA